MKAYILLITLFILLGVKLANAQDTIKVQFIHNAPDLALATVDLYINDSLYFDNFKFRTASKFVEISFGDTLKLGIANSNSTSVKDVFFKCKYPANYLFPVYYDLRIVFEGTEKEGSNDNPKNFSFIDELGKIYGETKYSYLYFSSYLYEFDHFYDIECSDYSDYWNVPGWNNVIFLDSADRYIYRLTAFWSHGYIEPLHMFYKNYILPLQTWNLYGKGVVLLESGYLKEYKNVSGPDFGLFLITPEGGNFLELPEFKETDVVFFNCSGDKTFNPIFFANNKIIDFFGPKKFPTEPFSFGASTSNMLQDTVKNFSVDLDENKNYIWLTNGFKNATGFNPFKPFDLHVFSDWRDTSTNPNRVDVLFYHGVSDNPDVDIYNKTNNTLLVDNIGYSEFSDNFISMPPEDVLLEIKDETGIQSLSTYRLPLSNKKGQTVLVVAKGFLYPENNSNGDEVSLYYTCKDFLYGHLYELEYLETKQNPGLISKDIKITPNPVKINLYISVGEKYGNYTCQLFNIQGKLLINKSANFAETTINIENLPSSVYFLKIISGNKEIKTFKILKN